jgi:gliding motility-associated-like protein
MTRLFLTLLLVVQCATFSSFAQPYGNEWIDYTKTYYKCKVGASGLYRIGYQTLQNAGLANNAASGFRLYHKGTEVPIFTTTNNVFSPTDYLEFYGEKNDGSFDTQLYAQPDWQANPYQSMFSDTSYYYLVWDDVVAPAPKRYISTPNNTDIHPPAETYFRHTLTQTFKHVATNGKPDILGGTNGWFPSFDDGEGITDVTLQLGNSKTYDFATTAPKTGFPYTPADLRLRVIGLSNDAAYNPDHAFTVRVNNTTYLQEQFESYDNTEYTAQVFATDIANDTTHVVVESTGVGYSITTIPYLTLTYTRRFDFGNQRSFLFTLNNNAQKYLEIVNFNGGDAPVLYDLTNGLRLIPNLQNDTLKILLPAGNNTATPRQLYLSNTNSPCTIGCVIPECNPAQCILYAVPHLTPIQFTNFNDVANQGNYIIITHSSLRLGNTDWVTAYQNYRESVAGGGYNVVVADIDELYDQYSAGIPKHPLSIQRFLDDAILHWSIAPQYVLLLGKSIGYANIANSYYNTNLIPTYGSLPSDNRLTAQSDQNYLPRLPIGRVSAINGTQVGNYLRKVIDYETPKACTRQAREWTKRAMQISNAWNNAEQTTNIGYLNNYANTIENSTYGGTVSTFDICSNACTPPSGGFPEITNQINEGIGTLTFFGHSIGSTSFGVDEISDLPTNHTNYGRYPFVLSGGAFTGNVHQYAIPDPNNSFAERYLLADSLGVIGLLGRTSWTSPGYLDHFLSDLHQRFTTTNYGQTMGKNVLSVYQDIYEGDPNNEAAFDESRKTCYEMTFVGDPALVLAGAYSQPELLIENNDTYTDVQLFDHQTNQLLGTSINNTLDSIDLKVHLSNIGAAITGNMVVRVQRGVNGGALQTIAQQAIAIPVASTNLVFTVAVDALNNSGTNQFVVTIDANNQQTEDCEDNNQVSLLINVDAALCTGLAMPIINETLPSSICLNALPITLSATPTGGTFSGTGITDNTFAPTLAGNYIINYSYTYPNGCQLSATKNIIVEPNISAAFSNSNNNLCINQSVSLQIDNYNPNATYQWSLDEATVLSDNNSWQSVVWQTAGIKTVTLTVALNGCSDTYTQTITVVAPLAVPTVVCTGASLNTISISWDLVEGATSYNIYINDALAQIVTNTNFTIGGLDQAETILIEVIAVGNSPCGNSEVAYQSCTTLSCPDVNLIIPLLETNTNFCKNETPTTLVSEPAGGVFNIDGNEVTAITPVLLMNGEHTLTVDYVLDGCSYQQVYTIYIHPQPDAQIVGSLLVAGDVVQTLQLADNSNLINYQWSNGEQTPTISVGNGTYTVTVTNVNGCTAVSFFEVTLIPDAVAPVINPNTSAAVLIPNAITPNNDGYNDTWQLPDLGEPNPPVQIFDRQGHLVWNSQAYQNNFDGRDNQQQTLSANTYYYVIRLLKSKTISGSLTIVR